MEKTRLQKILSRAGFGSRRDGEKLISEKRVTVNGKIAELGEKADPLRDQIAVDGETIKYEQPDQIYIAFYKPKNVLSQIKKINKRKIVTDYIPLEDYLFIVGRLDFNSEGLILLTNDGEIANRLTHPRYEHEKEYHVEINVVPDDEQLESWRHGVVLATGYRTLPAEVNKLREKKGNWLRVVLKEGKKRQIRELGRILGLHVKRIIRIRIANIKLTNLKPGEWRYLSEKEIKELKHLHPGETD